MNFEMHWMDLLSSVVLTYFVHSSIVIGLVWLISRDVFRVPLAARHLLWKLCFVGPIVTTALALTQPSLRWTDATPFQSVATSDAQEHSQTLPLDGGPSLTGVAPALKMQLHGSSGRVIDVSTTPFGAWYVGSVATRPSRS